MNGGGYILNEEKTIKAKDKQETRIDSLKELLIHRKFVTLNEASSILGVSTMTVRRDCEKMRLDGTLYFKNGVIFLNDDNDFFPIKKNYVLENESLIQNNAKLLIGKYAASLISNNDTIIIDTGSTTDNILPFVDKDININLYCSNLNILSEALKNDKINIYLSGGNYHPNTQMFVSDQAIEFLKTFRANKAFISAAGVHEKLGLTCINPHEVKTKLSILNSSQEHILLVDSSKFNKVHACCFADLSEINTVITDNGISDEWKHIIENLGIKLHIVE